MEQKTIELLRKFFTISVAAFEFQNSITIAFRNQPKITHMHSLHTQAKEEVFRDRPNMFLIDMLLEAMEEEAKND